MDCKLHWYPKFYYHVILFIGSYTSLILLEFYNYFQTISVQTFKPIISIYVRSNFFSIICPLSYPLKSLQFTGKKRIVSQVLNRFLQTSLSVLSIKDIIRDGDKNEKKT